MNLSNSTWLITGGPGSLGTHITKVILSELNPKSIRIYSRSELPQIIMSSKINDSRVRYLIGDVRDKDRLYRAVSGVDYVIHAAALKQVPIAEYNPHEVVLTNIIGSMNVVDSAINLGVKKIIGISSDKACQPVNLYGKTKAVMENLFTQANVYARNQSKFSCTRYGNVIGSRGSVIPVFLEQKKSGIIRITDTRMTRFWITLDQGVHFVLNCLEFMKGGEIFVPKIPSCHITDLVDVIAPECKRLVIGIRPGEKLHEILITKDEARHTHEHEDYYTIIPLFPYWTESTWDDQTGRHLDDTFEYRSDNNDNWLTKEHIARLVDEYRKDSSCEVPSLG